jgi:hypothetical protein
MLLIGGQLGSILHVPKVRKSGLQHTCEVIVRGVNHVALGLLQSCVVGQADVVPKLQAEIVGEADSRSDPMLTVTS